MPFLADRVKDTTTTAGTGALTLAGSPPTGFRTFATGLGSVAVSGIPYVIDDGAGAWEVGEGTFNGTTGLTRELVLASSNSNALVSFSAGTKTVHLDAPATLVQRSSEGRLLAMKRRPLNY